MDISKIIYSSIKFIPFYFIFLFKVLNIDVKDLIFFKSKYINDNVDDPGESGFESDCDSDNETARESISECSEDTIKQIEESDVESGEESDVESGEESDVESEKNFKIKSILNDLDDMFQNSKNSNKSSNSDDDVFLTNMIKYELSDDSDDNDELSEMI